MQCMINVGFGGVMNGICVFCEIVVGWVFSDKVVEDVEMLVFMDIDLGVDGYFFVILKWYSVDLFSVLMDDFVVMMVFVQWIIKVMYFEFGVDGVNFFNCCGIVGWQMVFYFYLYVILCYIDRSKDRMELFFILGVLLDVEVRKRYVRMFVFVFQMDVQFMFIVVCILLFVVCL